MGMFDYLRCEFPLPGEGMNARTYQTKDTDAQALDLYVIRPDGSLWHEEVERECVVGAEHPLGFALRAVSREWQREADFTGEVRFYDYEDGTRRWIEFSAYFLHGALQSVALVEDRTPEPVLPIDTAPEGG